MNYHISSHVKLGLVGEILNRPLLLSISLKWWLKSIPCNVEKKNYTNETYFLINSVWPRDRLSDQ